MLSSIGRRDYSRLAKATADDLVRSYAAAARSSSNYGELVSQASTLKSQENAALTKISGELTGKAIKARTDIKTNKIINEAKADYKQNVRKAGVLAAAGKMFGSIKDAGGKKPVEPYKSKTDYAGKEADLRTQAEAELSKITPVDLDLSTTTTTDTSTTTGSKPGQTIATATTVTPPSSSSLGWSKWSKVIRTAEGTPDEGGYTRMFGGGQFTDTSKHPDTVVSASGYNSTAAGAYQFLTPTWNEAASALGLTDFSPASQEKAGEFLTRRRGVDTSKIITDYDTFVTELDKLAPEWAGLPYQPVSPKGFGKGSSYYGQGGLSAPELWKIYNSN